MKKANIDDMEIGNLLFGHSRGEFQIDRDKWSEIFLDFLEECGFDSYGYIENNELENFIKLDKGISWYAKEVDINPEVLRKSGIVLDVSELNKMGIDFYEDEEVHFIYNDKIYCVYSVPDLKEKDYLEEDDDKFIEKIKDAGFKERVMEIYSDDSEFRHFENDVFIVRPYYWGDSLEIANLPNFVYKPLNFTINWYKYPLRDAYCSHDIGDEEFIKILNDCKKSLK